MKTQLEWNTNSDFHTQYSMLTFNDLQWPWLTLRIIQWHEASRGLSATAELLVFISSCDSRRGNCFGRLYLTTFVTNAMYGKTIMLTVIVTKLSLFISNGIGSRL